MNKEFFYTCGADVTFDSGGDDYVCSHMGYFDTFEDAFEKMQEINKSFGSSVYYCEFKIKHGLKISYGIRTGSPTSGHRLIKRITYPYLGYIAEKE